MNDQPTGSADIAAQPETLRFSYVPREGLLKLTIVNFLLGLITLSIYRFWAKTNVRKHVWSCVQINGEPLEYSGRGIELFKGALVVFLFVILPVVLVGAAVGFYYGPQSPALTMLQFLFLLVIYVFWGFAVYKARKYQLSRTNWRGIRGTLAGSAMTYSLLFFGSLMAKGMSLGWATPVMNTVLQEQIVNDMRFGDAAFKFKGRAGPLYPTYALCWFLTVGAMIVSVIVLSAALAGWLGTEIAAAFQMIFGQTTEGDTTESRYGMAALIMFGFLGAILLFFLVLPMLWAVYTAKELRTFANYTRFDGAQFHLDAKTGAVIWLAVVNLITLIFTLGIGWPYVTQRTVRFVVDRLSLAGAIDIDRIAQSQARLDARGEGLADMFDIGGLW